MAIVRYEIRGLCESTRSVDVYRGTSVDSNGARRGVSAVAPCRSGGVHFSHAFAETAALFSDSGHPGLARVEDVRVCQGRAFALTPSLAGTSLARALAEPSRSVVTADMACRFVLRLADAAHELSLRLGSALGGLAADSIWVSSDFQPLLLPSVRAIPDGADEAFTRYAAPEVRRGEARREAADVYALGLILWELLSAGRVATPTVSANATRSARAIAPSLLAVVLRALSETASERPKTSADFLVELSRASSSQSAEVVTAEFGAREVLLAQMKVLDVARPPVRLAHDAARVRLAPALASSRGRHVDDSVRARPAPASVTPSLDPAPVVQPRPAPARSRSPMLRVVTASGTPPELVLAGASERWVVGRASTADLVVCDPDMSREHFEVVKESGAFLVYDLGSKNGLFVNGARADGHALRPGDEVHAGATRLRFEA